jgi:hypothetical protein
VRKLAGRGDLNRIPISTHGEAAGAFDGVFGSAKSYNISLKRSSQQEIRCSNKQST